MSVDYSIDRWVHDVAGNQWRREDQAFEELGRAVPAILGRSRPLAEVHRLDLSLFVIFEDVSLRVSGALTRRAPNTDALKFCAQQTLDEARHYELFHRHLNAARAAAGLPEGDVDDDILIPPLKRFIEQCYEVADAGSFIEGLTLVNLILEGTAYPLYGYEERYWQPIDPLLARTVRAAFADETRHVAFGAHLVANLLRDDPDRRARVQRLCDDARRSLHDIFNYYIRRFVGMFDVAAKQHKDLFAGAEFAPGRLISETPYAEQVQTLRHSIDVEHTRLLQRAGLA
jgi:hypothetical protein